MNNTNPVSRFNVTRAYTMTDRRSDSIAGALNKNGENFNPYTASKLQRSEVREAIIRMGVVDRFLDWAFDRGRKAEVLNNLADMLTHEIPKNRAKAFMWMLNNATPEGVRAMKGNIELNLNKGDDDDLVGTFKFGENDNFLNGIEIPVSLKQARDAIIQIETTLSESPSKKTQKVSFSAPSGSLALQLDSLKKRIEQAKQSDIADKVDTELFNKYFTEACKNISVESIYNLASSDACRSFYVYLKPDAFSLLNYSDKDEALTSWKEITNNEEQQTGLFKVMSQNGIGVAGVFALKAVYPGLDFNQCQTDINGYVYHDNTDVLVHLIYKAVRIDTSALEKNELPDNQELNVIYRVKPGGDCIVECMQINTTPRILG